MHITVLSVGKIKETYWHDALQEYIKRLSRYAKVHVVEISEEKAKEPLSKAEIHNVLEKEGARILAQIPTNSYSVALAIDGKQLTSPALAQTLHELTTYGESHITFIIGGSYGLSAEVHQKAQYRLSFSKFTFPHQLMRVILLEQIYRAFKINRGEAYHK